MSPPPGPLATALVAARLSADTDSRQVREPHIFNTAADIEAALRAIRAVLA